MDSISGLKLKKRGRRVSCLIAVMGFLTMTQGCVVFPLILGAGAGAGGYAWYNGYLKKQYNVEVPKAASAAEHALEDLGFRVDSSDFDKFGAKITGHRATGERFIVVMDHAGVNRTTVKVRVGIPGDKDMASEVHKSLQARL